MFAEIDGKIINNNLTFVALRVSSQVFFNTRTPKVLCDNLTFRLVEFEWTLNDENVNIA